MGGTSSVSGSAGTTPAGGKPVCPRFHAAVELIGRRWTGSILFTLIDGPHFFRELLAAVPGISDRLLSQRLRELEAEGIVERTVHDGAPARVSYRLTAAGRELEPALRELYRWAQQHPIDGAG
jgi:DNA-binding HxlR family transcriptional regulator